MADSIHNASSLRTWIMIGFLFLFILVKGLYAFTLIGDRGQPDWSYGTLPDVPSQSPYAVYDLLPYPQHVKGKQGK